MNWKIFLCLAGFGTFASVAPQASYAEVTGMATFTRFSFSLIDLDPNDGVSPSFTMTLPSYSVGAANYLGNSGTPHLNDWLQGPGVAIIDDASGKAQSSYDGITASSSVTVYDASPMFRSDASVQWKFTLSPHTSLTLSGYGTVDSSRMGKVEAGGYVQLYAAYYVSSSDPFSQPYIYDDLNTLYGDHQSREMNITFASDDAQINGYLGFSATASGQDWSPVATPVPEPSTHAMLICGLISLACAVRRKAQSVVVNKDVASSHATFLNSSY
ncbi:MAG: hypothetical protein ABIQ08_15190 [Duganella sp.]